MTTDAATTTLWDRSRQLATQEILATALRLFDEQGYDATSIAQIAKEAGVSQRTIFRYFGAKEDLLAGGHEVFRRVMIEAVAAAPADADAWAALRAGLAAVQSTVHEDRAQALARLRLVHGTASLRAGALEKRLGLQGDLLPLVRARMGLKAGARNDLRAAAVIATAFACLDVASAAWVARDGRGDLMDLYDQALAAAR